MRPYRVSSTKELSMIDSSQASAVARLAAEGYSQRQIADKLQLCRSTIQRYIADPTRGMQLDKLKRPKAFKLDAGDPATSFSRPKAIARSLHGDSTTRQKSTACLPTSEFLSAQFCAMRRSASPANSPVHASPYPCRFIASRDSSCKLIS